MPVSKFLLKWASVPLWIKEGLLFLQMGAGLGILVWLLVLCAHFGPADRMGKHSKHVFARHHLGEALLLCWDGAAFLCSVRSLLEGSFWETFLPSVCVRCSQEFCIYCLNSGSSVCGSSSVWNRSCSCSDMFQARSSLTSTRFWAVIFPSIADLLVRSSRWAQIFGSLAMDPKFLCYQCLHLLCWGFCRSVLHAIASEQQPRVLGQP